MPGFLLEIGVEEIPDWMIEPALADLRDKFQNAFASFGGDALRTEATPRRLVLIASDLLSKEPDRQTVILGPYLSAGPKAAEGFARKNNAAVANLATTSDAKGERYVVHQEVPGQDVASSLQKHLPAIIASITFPKSMYWTGKNDVRFIRPIRWIVALLDGDVVPFELAGVESGATTRGHRILGSPDSVPVTTADFEAQLRANFVLLRANDRRERITSQLGSDVHHDPELIDTLVYLTEWPSVIRGSFDPAFLELPREILTTVMRHHQRYFSVLAPDGSLAPAFLAVTNTDGDPDGLIRQGNERVLRARFNDARFFWQVDQRRTLHDRLTDLQKVTYQAKLGTYKDKTDRVVELARSIAGQLNADIQVTTRAALLAKCDLTTDMVKEFTELQGIVGGLYARQQGEGEPVATAIYHHYQPVTMEGAIPPTLEAQVVAIADKLDTLQQCFAVGLIPTGSRDPFALRRAAQGLIKILFEARLDLALFHRVDAIPALATFLRERIDFYLRETGNYAYDEVNAVLAAPLTTLPDILDRVDALHYIRPTGDFEPLAASFKRIKNILRQAAESQTLHPNSVDQSILTAGPEQNLQSALDTVHAKLADANTYRDKLTLMGSLRPHVDLFFDKILVNDPNPTIRQNRLALLTSLLTRFASIADFSEIVTEGTSA